MTACEAVMSAREGTAGGVLRRWGALAAILAVLWLMLGIVIPAVQRVPAMSEPVEVLLDSGIEVSAIYYTGVEKVAEAESVVRGAVGRTRP